jgi:uncharacterized protein with PIN domain
MSRPQARVAVADELALFLRPKLRAQPVAVTCDGVSTLGHVIGSIGIPLTEVAGLIVNGRPAERGYRPRGGDSIQVSSAPRPELLDDARFLLDVHLGTVARRLRLLGIDAAYHRDADDDDLIEEANAAGRVLLTQDRGLLCRRKLWRGAYVRGANPDAQLTDILDRFAPPLAPWTRCTACNGMLVPVRKEDVEPQLKPGTRRTYAAFARCQACGQVYWRGAHSSRLEATIGAAARVVSEARARAAAAGRAEAGGGGPVPICDLLRSGSSGARLF